MCIACLDKRVYVISPTRYSVDSGCRRWIVRSNWDGSVEQQRCTTRRGQGFTLIELLVVIAVIAILMAILVPVLGRARDQAYTIVCRSNLKGYGMGLRMYLDDNDSRLPMSRRYMKSEFNHWVQKGEEPDGSFWPYVKDLDAHMCSKFSKLVKDDVTFRDTAVSYVMNSYIGDNRFIGGNWLGSDVVGVVFETEVYNPSRVMVFTEENTWTIQDYSMFPFNSTHCSPWATGAGRSTTMLPSTTRAT